MSRIMTHSRPTFKVNVFNEAWPFSNDPPKVTVSSLLTLEAMQLSDLFIQACHGIDVEDTHNCCVETALIARVFHYIEYEVDLNDPDGIQSVMKFFRDMLLEFAPRYIDENGQSHINANLGELYSELEKPSPKQIVHLLAFGIKETLTDAKTEDECITNKMDHDNHSINYHVYNTIFDAVKSMTDLDVTDESFNKNVVRRYIALADTHTRSGTFLKGNCYKDFMREVNNDPALSDFCRNANLKLFEKLRLGDRTYTTCQPIIIDMLLGTLNFVLYALFVKAKTGNPLHAFVATSRTHPLFKHADGENFAPIMSELLVVGFGDHPNFVERYLGKRKSEEVLLMDYGMALSLQPLHNCIFDHVDESGNLATARLNWGLSDSFLRTFNYRNFEKPTMEGLKELQKKLCSINKRIEKAQAKRRRKEMIKSNAESRMKENEALQKKKYTAVSVKRAKMATSAFDLLS